MCIRDSNSTSTVIYQSTGAQSISSAPLSYGHLTAQGGGTKTLAGNLVVEGDLSIAGSAGLDVSASNYSIQEKRNWAVSSTKVGPFTCRNGTVTFAGTSSSDISSCLLYTSPSPRDRTRSRMPSSA